MRRQLTDGQIFQLGAMLRTFAFTSRLRHLHTQPHRSTQIHAGALKTQVLENASTKQRISQGWKTHVWKTQVRICRDGKRKYGKCKYNANLQSDKKSLVLHKLVWCIFKWGGQVDYRLFFSEMT